MKFRKKGVAEFEAWTPEYLMEKMQLTPAQFIDLKALMGDSSDNYPGVTKVGEKTALNLLHEWGSLENIYANVESLKKSKMKENLIADKEMAFLSQTLATIDTVSPIEIGLDDTVYSGPKVDELSKFYDEMGFSQFKTKLNVQNGDTSEEIQAAAEKIDFKVINASDEISVDANDFYYIEILGDNYHKEEIIGFAWGNDKEVFVSKDLSVLAKLTLPVNTYDYKKNRVLLNRIGVTATLPNYDGMLAKYLISTTEDNKISTISRLFDNGSLRTDEEIFGKGSKLAIPSDEVLFASLAHKVHTLAVSKDKMLDALEENEQISLLTEMELPLAEVLAKMEIQGIYANKETLEVIGQENEERLSVLTKEIYDLAGEEFNINSTKQLGVILFEKLNLPHGKKTKTGYSTAVDVLEGLAPIAPVVAKILEYRQVSKVQSTYVKGLIPQIAEDGKIHTRYVQDLTQTGRLSSVDPNLQNIPVRLEEGRKIRKAFVPSENSTLLSSDYSQVELRVLAHVAQDPNLIAAFKEDADIHTSTAMRVFNIAKAEDVTANDRRSAKAVNFGISYGETEYGLARRLGIPNKEAGTIIKTYFERYPEVATYIEKNEARC